MVNNDCGNWFARNFPFLGASIITVIILYFTDPTGFMAFFKPLTDPLTLIMLGAVAGMLYVCQWSIMNIDPITGEIRKW